MLLVAVLVLSLCACGAAAPGESSAAPTETASSPTFMAGYGKVDITPQESGVPMSGYASSSERLSTGLASYLYAIAVAVQDEDGNIEEDVLMEAALEAGASDFEGDEGFFEIYTEPDDVYTISEALAAQGYKITSAERAKIPSTYVTLTSEEDIEDMQTMLEKFEEYDDITNVYHNWEM